jgi:hypothetical protein
MVSEDAERFSMVGGPEPTKVEVVGQETGPDGEIGYFVSVRTELLRSLHLGDHELERTNALLMAFASMAGPVYDQESKTLSLCSLVRVHEAISNWMNLFISVAAVLQIGEARIIASEFAKALGAEEAWSGHPCHGMRPTRRDGRNDCYLDRSDGQTGFLVVSCGISRCCR